jgi:peptidoglycan biosynthesis protein MviN/MurJ (putative lipid II flippase)
MSSGVASPSIGRAVLGRSTRRTRMLTAGGGTVLGSVPGFLLPFAIVHAYGASRTADAYFFSAGTVLFCASLFSVALETATIPFAIEWAAHGPRTVRRETARLVAQAAAGATCVYALVSLLAVQAVGLFGRFNPEQVHQIRTFLLVLGALPGLVAATSVLSGSLNGRHDYFLPAVTQGARSAAGLLVLLVIGGGHHGLYLVAAAFVVAEAGRLVLLTARLVRRRGTGVPGADLPQSAPAHAVWRVVAPQFAGMALVGLNPVVDKLVAAALPVGAITLIELAERIYYVPRTLATSAVGVVSTASWSELVHRGRRKLLRDDFRATQRRTVLIGGMASLVMCAVAVSVLPLLAPRVHVPNGRLLTVLTVVFLVGLAPGISADLGTRLLAVLRTTWILPLFAVVNFGLNLGVDVGGAFLFGAVGIALATTVMRFAAAGMYAAYIGRLLRPDGAVA